MHLNQNDKKYLLKLARETIVDFINNKNILKISEDSIPDTCKVKCGAFVSLHKNGKLRGCIGHFGEDIPLFQTIQEMAIAAATNDYRFSPVNKTEIDLIEIEISVLTPMKKIQNISEIVLGKHGIYIKIGNRGGTFLPQVATQTNWTLEEFLGHCSQDKAGLGWDGWKKAELFIYEAIVFSENEV